MRLPRLAASTVILLSCAGLAAGQSEEPFRPRGAYNGAVHRFFPDLDSRLNAVRYARWQALEVAWVSGINPHLDREFSARLERLLADPPRFPPEEDRVAPRLAREAVPIFRALRWGQTFEQQVLDILASSDATPPTIARRLERALDLYRRERYALSAPEGPPPQARAVLDLAPQSARILIGGAWLFARAAEDLAVSDFGQQRWRVRETIEEYARTYAAERAPADARYARAAASFAGAHPEIAEHLDRLAEFRLALFVALIPGAETPAARRERGTRARELARRYGLPLEGIGRR